MREIYVVSQEWCDKGWHYGDQLFTDRAECVKHLRDYVAQTIMYLRKQGYTIDCFHKYSDNSIYFRAMKDFEFEYWDFRVSTMYLWETNEQYRNGRWPWNM